MSQAQPGTLNFGAAPVGLFSAPDNATGYSLKSISDDLITAVYMDFIVGSRKRESEQFCRSTSGVFICFTVIDKTQLFAAIALSLDHTLKVAKKAKIVSSSLEHRTPFSGGWLSVINEHGQTISWVSCDFFCFLFVSELGE